MRETPFLRFWRVQTERAHAEGRKPPNYGETREAWNMLTWPDRLEWLAPPIPGAPDALSRPAL